MKQYILTIIGISIISIICDSILTQGKIKKYARFAISLILSIALIYPAVDFLKQKSGFLPTFEEVEIDYSFSLEQTVKAFYKNATVTVMQDGNMITKIYIDLSQEKLLDKAQAELLKNEVKNILSQMYGIDEQDIIFNF